MRLSLKFIYLMMIMLNFFLIRASPIYSNLWSNEMLGSPQEVRFINENEFLLLSDKGMVSKLKTNGEVQWKKNMIYKSAVNLDSAGAYSLLVNTEIGYIDLISNRNSQLVWSINFKKSDNEIKNIRTELIHVGKTFIGVLVSSNTIKIFNNERVISEFDAKQNEVYLDFIFDESKLQVASLIDNKILEINEIKISKSITNIVNKFTTTLSKSINLEKAFLTVNFCTLFTNKDKFYIVDLNENKVTKKKLGFNIENYSKDVKKLKNLDKIVIYKNSKIEIINLKTADLKAVGLKKEKIGETYHWDFVDNINSCLYLLRKKNINTYSIYELKDLRDEIYKINKLTSFTDNDEVTVKSFYVNPMKPNSFIFITNEDSIKIITDGSILTLDQSLSNISFSEMIVYFDEQSSNQNIYSHNTLENILIQKDISNVLNNVFTILMQDLLEMYNCLKYNVEKIIQKKNEKTFANLIGDFKHYIIIFTRSQQLNLINALNGQVILTKKYKNKKIVKIIKNTNQDINYNKNKFVHIILKDYINNTFSVLKLNLETTELVEDNTLISLLQFEEEIISQYENLLKNPSLSPLILTGKLPKSYLDIYEDKLIAENNNNSIYGIKFKQINSGFSLSIAWNLLLKPNCEYIDSQFPTIHQNTIGNYHATGKVLYKYIDANLMLVLSKNDNKNLVVTVIKANTGKVLHQSYINNVDFNQTIKHAFEENIIIISYIKKEKSVIRNEIFSIEIMKREIEHSFVQLLEKKFKIGEFDSSYENTENIHENDLVFLTQTFILTRKVKHIYTSKTKLNISNKFFIFLLENNQIFLLDKRGISPRRPLVKEEKGKQGPPIIDPMNSPYIDPEGMPYQPLISLDHKFTINLNFLQDQIDNILVSPTRHESTFIICTQGLSMSCYSVYPDKSFDTLSNSFTYSVIGVFIVGIITLTYLLRKYVKKNEFRQNFLNSN